MSKLVRNKIPDIIKQHNQMPVVHVADEGEYWQKLKEKLKEEVDEFLADSNDEELADILEVICAICDFKKIDREKLEIKRVKKVEERGGFEDRKILDRVKPRETQP